jgi:ABC-type lipoprotein export system ATPase subunit/bifunctional DNA-binding transcriptional regulator/antitoxin component of YhaV-PrlF toxin-antitoxin module
MQWENLLAEESIVICDNLMKIHKVANLEVVALQGLDLTVRRGELLGIVGASGSGKSTFLNILGGLDRPSAGRIWVNGKDLLKMSNRALLYYRRLQVGFVWQQSARNLIPFLDAQENIELPLTLAGESPAAKRSRSRELLSVLGLADRGHHALGQLSGGEQQRVAIAVALVHNPILLLADEPTGEVDSATALSIYQAFRDLNRIYGLTTLIVSHDQTIAHHVDRVVAIQDGKLSRETMRQPDASADDAIFAGPHAAAPAPAPVFEELVVLDAAGRLQLPKEYLTRFNIKGRARLEVTEEGVLILPAEKSAAAQAETVQPAVLTQAAAPRPASASWLRKLKRP